MKRFLLFLTMICAVLFVQAQVTSVDKKTTETNVQAEDIGKMLAEKLNKESADVASVNYPQEMVADSYGLAPAGNYVAQNVSGLKGPASEALIVFDMAINHFTLNNPAGATAYGTSNSEFLNSAEYYAGTYYFATSTSGQFGTINPTNGAVTVISTGNPYGGIAYNPVDGLMYGLSLGSNATLYTIDITSGASTQVVVCSSANFLLGMTITNDGHFLVIDAEIDGISELNPTTGSLTTLFTSGFIVNYGQDMAMDRETNTPYWAAYNNSGGGPQLYQINYANATSTLIGAFSAQASGFAVMTEANPDLAAAPTNFVVTPDPDQNLSASLSWTNPSTTIGGTALSSISSVVLKRNGTTIQEFTSPTVGGNMTFEDVTVPVAGTYAYAVYAVTSEGNGAQAAASVIIGGIFFMPTTGTQTIAACSGVIYDSGGPDGNYSSNENGILIIEPNGTELGVQLSGTFAGIETNYDKLYIYDGAGIEGELLGTYSNSSGGDIPLTSSTLGPLTLHFTSDGSVVKAGFELTISCQTINTGCLPPANLAVSNVTNESVELTWFVYGEQNMWNIEYGPMGFTQGSGTVVSASTNPYTLTGLEAATAYDWYIQANCGEAGTSSWSGPGAFITAVACPEGFNSVAPQVGTGNDETYYIPVNTFYRYSYVQQILTADELMEQGAFFGNVYSVSFQYFYSTAQTKNPVKIYLGITDKTSFASTSDWVSINDMTLVYEGSVTFDNTGAGYWVNIQFQTPFVYDGASNVVVAFLNNNGDYTTSSSKTFYTHANNGTGKTLHYRVDGSTPIDPANPPTASGILDYRNNMKLEMCVTTPTMSAVTGVVTSSLTGNPIEGASVKYQGALGGTVITDANGAYSIELVENFQYAITVTAEGYHTYAETGYTVPAGSDVKNFALDRPVISVSPASVEVTTNYMVNGHAAVTVSNTGTGNLNFSLATQYTDDGGKDAWDLVASFSATAGGMQGVATDGQYIYLTSWQASPTAGHSFEKYDLDLNFVEGFNISGVSQLRDLTYDGTYFYGGSGSSTLYCLDLANQTLVSSVSTGVSTIRHCSYDPENDGFWVGNWSDLYRINRAGVVQFTATSPSDAYGSGYDDITEGGPYLLLFCQPNSNALVYRYNIATNTIESTPIFDFAATPGYDAGAGVSGGAFVGNYDGKICFFGNIQQAPNLIGIYELGLMGWLTLDVTSATVPAGSSTTFNMTMDGWWAEQGTFYATVTAKTSDPAVGDIPIPVVFSIVPPDCDRPTNLLATIFEYNSVYLTWDAPADGTPVGYNVYYGEEQLPFTYVTSNHYEDMYLEPGEYCYNVRAVYDDGCVSYGTGIVCIISELQRGTVEGTVTDMLTGEPIEGATVKFSNEFIATTDAAGEYSIEVIVGPYTAEISASGYYNATAEIDVVLGTQTLDVALDVQCSPATNVTAVVNNDDVTISWSIGKNAKDDIILNETFETGAIPTGWTNTDADGDGYLWDAETGLGLFVGHSGECISSASYINYVGALTPDNWLITPVLDGPGSVNYWVNAQDAAYAYEHYGVYASTSGTNPSDFTLLFEETMTAKGEKYAGLRGGSKEQGAWYERTVENIPAGTKYIAFRHFNCTDAFWLNLDDVTIYGGGGSGGGDAEGYNLYRNGSLIGEMLEENTFLDENLAVGSYNYCVEVVYLHCTSSWSCVVADVSVDCSPVANIYAVANGYESVDIQWLAPGAKVVDGNISILEGLLGYNVYRNGNKINSSLVTNLEYSDNNVNPATEYCYKIAAVYETCETMSEVEACVTTEDACLPPSSITLTQLDGEDDVRIEWTAPSAGTPLGYNVYRDDVKIAYVITAMFTVDLNAPAGNYTYGVTAVYPTCESEAVEDDITVLGIGIFENMNVYPNPSNNKVYISGIEVTNVKVYNSLGQLVESVYNEDVINVSTYNSGVYFFTITDVSGNQAVSRVVVTK
ncbi:MAG: choice-of-anchor J domain-containing protein [Bacteroidales bacterium]|nr:choice-of-anchor J domain-containing protein [Bacteroidales bacterium]